MGSCWPARQAQASRGRCLAGRATPLPRRCDKALWPLPGLPAISRRQPSGLPLDRRAQGQEGNKHRPDARVVGVSLVRERPRWRESRRDCTGGGDEPQGFQCAPQDPRGARGRHVSCPCGEQGRSHPENDHEPHDAAAAAVARRAGSARLAAPTKARRGLARAACAGATRASLQRTTRLRAWAARCRDAGSNCRGGGRRLDVVAFDDTCAKNAPSARLVWLESWLTRSLREAALASDLVNNNRLPWLRPPGLETKIRAGYGLLDELRDARRLVGGALNTQLLFEGLTVSLAALVGRPAS